MSETGDAAGRAYHHGDLKSALIAATIDLIREKRLEEVSVADAARRAGVSSGAPYRHFKDRDVLIAHVAAEGFRRLAEAERGACLSHPPGSIDRLIALGCAYTEFGVDNPELFHVMWSAARHEDAVDIAREAGVDSYSAFIDELTGVMAVQRLGALDPHDFGAPLWAMVHGFAGLLIVNPDVLDTDREAVRRRIAATTRAYFAGYGASIVPPPREAGVRGE